MERKGRGKLGKGAGKLPGRQRRCCCCCAPNHPAAAVDATPLSRAKTSGMRVFHSSTPRADSRPGLAVAGSRRVAGAALRRRRGTRGFIAEAGCRRAADLDAAWGSRGPGRRVRAAAACGLCTWEGSGAGQKEWDGGPYPNWAPRRIHS